MSNLLLHARSPSLIRLDHRSDNRGMLAILEFADIPFEIERTFFMFGQPGMQRGQHAHHGCHEIVVPVTGGLTITTDNGREKVKYRLDQPTEALHLPPMVWRVLDDFTPGSACAVFASMKYDPSDYIHDYQAFLRLSQDI